jgi:hypothetical protein
MTSGSHTHTAPHPQLRLRLKPQGPVTGYVDGAWWPRSRDLTVELPALAEVVAVRLGQIKRVAYALSTWDATPRRFEVDGYRVRLEGFTYQDPNVIHVTGSSRGRISLLVVPPEMADAAGNDALMTAARQGNADRPEDILAAIHVPAQRRPHEYSAARWDGDDRQVHELD